MSTQLDAFQASITNHSPGPNGVAQIERIREAARTLGVTLDREAPASRERSLAFTHLEETVMWAVKSIVLPRQETLL